MIRRIVPHVALSVLVLCLFVALAPLRAAEDQYFDSNGVKIHYIVEGQGEPVILIHGFTASIQVQWGRGVISKLNKDYQVIALDNRGHGRSDKPHDPNQYGVEMVNDVIRLMDHLKIPKAHIVGYSMGGFITGNLLANHPQRVITATLGGAGWAQPDAKNMTFITDLADSLEAGKGIGPLILHLTPADRPKPTEEQISSINSMLLLTNDPQALAACIRGMKNLAVTEAQLKANKVPALALIGSKDPLKEGVDEMQKVMSDLKVEVIDGTDHMTAFMSPKFIAGLLGFLGAHAPMQAAASAAGN